MTDLVAALVTLGEALHAATLGGDPAPSVQSMHDWMTATPQPGDLVLETTTKYRGPVPERVGTFIKNETRAVCEHEIRDVSLERCEKCVDADRTVQRFVWLEELGRRDGKSHRHRWWNASFIRLPATRAQLEIARDVKPSGGAS